MKFKKIKLIPDFIELKIMRILIEIGYKINVSLEKDRETREDWEECNEFRKKYYKYDSFLKEKGY